MTPRDGYNLAWGCCQFWIVLTVVLFLGTLGLGLVLALGK